MSILTFNKCYIVGWGKTEENVYSNTPQHANIVEVEETRDDHLKAEIIQGMGEGTQRACFGDSGGPLICEIRGIPYLVGVNAEIHSDSSLDPSIPLESPERCSSSRYLQAVDIRKQLPTISSLLSPLGLGGSVEESQTECFQ